MRTASDPPRSRGLVALLTIAGGTTIGLAAGLVMLLVIGLGTGNGRELAVIASGPILLIAGAGGAVTGVGAALGGLLASLAMRAVRGTALRGAILFAGGAIGSLPAGLAIATFFVWSPPLTVTAVAVASGLGFVCAWVALATRFGHGRSDGWA